MAIEGDRTAKLNYGMGAALCVGLACLAVINFVVAPRLAAEQAGATTSTGPTAPKVPGLEVEKPRAVSTGATSTGPSIGPAHDAAVAAATTAADIAVAIPDVTVVEPDTAVAAAPDVAVATPDAAVAAAPAPDAGAGAAPAAMPSGEALLPAEIRFKTALVWLSPRYTKLLDAVAKAMARDPALKLVVRGHADRRGSAGYNKRLSKRRSQAIAYYLRQKQISPQRVTIESFGEHRPVAPGTSRDAWARNRRVELSWR